MSQILIKNTSQYKNSQALLLPKNERSKTNLLIGYCGENEQLRAWANKQAQLLELVKYSAPERVGGFVALFRQHLWREMQKGRIDSCLLQLLVSLRECRDVTLWFLNYRDVEMARLIRRYLEYCLRAGFFIRE